jgi:hypothetical protein
MAVMRNSSCDSQREAVAVNLSQIKYVKYVQYVKYENVCKKYVSLSRTQCVSEEVLDVTTQNKFAKV